jgi:hypothetical protein
MKKDCSMEEITERLQAPFPLTDIEWRVSRSGISNGKSWAMVLAYVTNRAIQNRLDEVFGPAGWKNDYRDFMQGILCTITCNINGEWISKADGAEPTQFESLKGGLSGAMKRAAVQWGIGRYLYNLEEVFVEVNQNKSNGAIYINDKKSNVKGYWLPPKLPEWALPENEKNQSKLSKTQNQSQTQKNGNPQKQQPSNREQNQNQKQSTAGHTKEGINRQAAVQAITGFLENTGLKENVRWIIPLFRKMNPELKQNNLVDVYQNATETELKRYYSVLRPVNDFVNCTKHYQISMEDSLRYAQILLPKVECNSIFALFLNLTLDHVKQIASFIEEDLQNGNLQKIA